MGECEECGFDYGAVDTSEIPALIESEVAEITALISQIQDSALRIRSQPSVWSPFEYACHVRDVLLVQRDRALLALVEDTPSFVPMYRDERVANAGYGFERVAEVSEELPVAARLISKLAAGMTQEQLARRCTYNFPEPTERDVGWVFRHTLHEVVHHKKDISDGLRSSGVT